MMDQTLNEMSEDEDEKNDEEDEDEEQEDPAHHLSQSVGSNLNKGISYLENLYIILNQL